jgi:hypothetical protein
MTAGGIVQGLRTTSILATSTGHVAIIIVGVVVLIVTRLSWVSWRKR